MSVHVVTQKGLLDEAEEPSIVVGVFGDFEVAKRIAFTLAQHDSRYIFSVHSGVEIRDVRLQDVDKFVREYVELFL